MFNVMKGDYLVARELLFAGVSEGKGRPRDTGVYFDTLDYAVYGATPSRLVLAQRTALDLLDKVAVALNDYARNNDPFAKLGTTQVSIEVSSVIRASPESFRVAWTERRYDSGQLTATDVTTLSGYPAKAVQGFPADAARYGLQYLRVNPDLLVSGINEGQNLSSSR